MNTYEYQRAISRGEFHQRNLPGVWRDWVPRTDSEKIGFLEGRACVWLREKGVIPPGEIGGAAKLAKSMGWKP